MTDSTSKTTVLYGNANVGDLKGQVARLRDAAAQRGLHVRREVLDRARGPRSRRTGLRDLMETMGKGETLLAVSVAAVATGTVGLAELARKIEKAGAALLLLDERIDMSEPSPVMATLEALAELDRAKVAERVKEAVKRARHAGRHVARPARWTDEDLEMALKLRAKGQSWRDVGRALGFSPRHVRRKLASTVAKASQAEAAPHAKKNGSNANT